MTNQTKNIIKGGSFLIEDISYDGSLHQKILQMSKK